MRLTALDLFSCIGCHALGFARAGISTVAMCEIEPTRREVLRSQFPGVPIHDDVRTFLGYPADIVIGGPPCGATSVAAAIHGKRTGETLWPKMLSIATAIKAPWIIVEQPPGNAAWEAQVTDDLSRAGYHTARLELAARDLGAPYLRRRVFIVASPDAARLALTWASLPSAIDGVKRAANARGDWSADQLGTLRVDARSAGEMDGGHASQVRRERIEALGDSNPPHMAEAIGRAIVAAAAQR